MITFYDKERKDIKAGMYFLNPYSNRISKIKEIQPDYIVLEKWGWWMCSEYNGYTRKKPIYIGTEKELKKRMIAEAL